MVKFRQTVVVAALQQLTAVQLASEGVTITTDTLAQGHATLQYTGGQLILYVNDSGVIKQLTLGSPAV